MSVTWIPGPPPGRGLYWICLGTDRIECVAIEPSLINMHDPNAKLLIKMIGGMAYYFDVAKDGIFFHAPLDKPEGPR